MAAIHGKTGAVYAASALIRGTTIGFTTASKITDSGNGFVAAGFTAGMSIVVVGALDANNNGTFPIAAGGVAAGMLTLTSSTITTAAAGPLITIYQAPAGAAMAGAYNWSADTECEALESTSFSDAGIRAYIAGNKGWTGSATRRWQDDGAVWEAKQGGSLEWIRLFEVYAASPSAQTPAIYWEGLAIVTASGITAPRDGLMEQTLNFQGVGALTLVTKTTSW